MELTPQDIAQVDAAYWANLNRIRLQKGVWSFDRRQYLVEPMQATCRRLCFMKGTQGGFTELEVNKSLHGMIFRRYPRGVLYLFPTTDDVREFSKARFAPLISANPTAIGRYVRNTDTASLKRVGDAFLYLRGAVLSHHLEVDARESSKMRAISVDKAKGRMGDSEVKEEVYISNPTLPDYGIANVFAESDQRHWFRKCASCGEFTCAELEFPGCVKYRGDGTGYIACKKCGCEVTPSPGEWVPSERENTAYMQGYRWSQLSSYQNDPGEILADYTDPPGGNLADIVRLRLGLPYVAAEDRLTTAEVLGCCGDYPQLNSHPGPCAIGIDCQKPKRVVIGIRSGRDQYRILRVAGFSEWNDISDMARRFNVKSGVVDIRPYEDAARAWQKAMRFRVYLCEYSESTPLGSTENDKTGIAKVNRTEIMDATHRLVTTPGQLVIPRRCPEIEEFATQMCATAKVLEMNKRTRQSVYRYRKLGRDDYRHALNYFYLAASGNKIGIASIGHHRRKRQTHAKSNYAKV
jgi:hypothetical protein